MPNSRLPRNCLPLSSIVLMRRCYVNDFAANFSITATVHSTWESLSVTISGHVYLLRSPNFCVDGHRQLQEFGGECKGDLRSFNLSVSISAFYSKNLNDDI